MITNRYQIISITLFISILSIYLNDTYGSNSSTISSGLNNYNELFIKYLNYWVNLPPNIASDSNVYDCVYHIEDNFIFLMDPYGKIKIDANCEFPAGKSIFTPFFFGWCDTGNIGYYGKPLNFIIQCLGPINSGSYQITAKLDGREIVNTYIKIDKNSEWQIIKNNFPSNNNLKIIDILDFFNLTVTNTTRYLNDYERPDDFAHTSKIYKAVGLCICGLIDSNLLPSGNHIFDYSITSLGTHSNIKPIHSRYDITIT